MRPRGLLALALVLPLLTAPVSAQKRRSVRHSGPGDEPTARADAYTVARGATLVRTGGDGVLANDTDPHALALTALVVSSTAHGTLVLTPDGGFTYVNDGSAATSDSFTYRASNGTSTSLNATVTIAITAPLPQANADAYNTPAATPLGIPAPGVLTNDTRNGANIASYGVAGTEQTTLSAATPTAHGGTVLLGADGAFTYNPGTGFTGSDAFNYVLTNAAGSSTAQVTISVVSPQPTAANDTYSTAQNTALTQPAPGVLANDIVNGGAITGYGSANGNEQSTLGTSTSTAKNGTVRVNADGSFTYTPPNGFNGSDSFRYTLANGSGSGVALVTITVQAAVNTEFNVTAPGFFYSFSGIAGQNPQLTLQRGRTYVFHINTTSSHPFEILDAPAGSVTNNNISSGTLTFVVPNTAANYRYHCSLHDFGNTIVTVP
ncbi:MAG: tandem-95 repeat protein [Acidobacteria bacterium]|nr:tandem-95 repeat protein [Acidobacteriota bacterium]MBV9475773.1 tandem-95 repeat protein [Acidobacteriota bacterium]